MMKKGKIRKNKTTAFRPIPGKFNVKITFSDVYNNDNDYQIHSIKYSTFESFEEFLYQYGLDYWEKEDKKMFDKAVKRLNEGLFIQNGESGIGEPYSIPFFNGELDVDYFMKIEIL
jgi:hypothetical protein